MDYLPLFFDLKNRDCLLVGGGSVATRKARLLRSAGATITVIAPECDPELQQLLKESGGSYCAQPFHAEAIDGKVLVVAATNDEAVNVEVSKQCQQRNIPVNVVDSPALCTVITPAIVDRSPLVIAVSSGGESPVLARKLRTQLETSIPGQYGELARLASQFRTRVKNEISDLEARRRFWEDALDGPIAELALNSKISEAERAFEKALRNFAKTSASQGQGEVYLVGAGPGDPDLLTLKAVRLMQRAEVVLYDRLVSAPILDMVRRDADRIYVGKQRSQHALPQAEINESLVSLAKQGKRVLRLKGGDPFIFGRGGEEIELLAENHIPFQVVPGITAASACACYAGIPLTHRDYSQSVRFITGHLKNDETNLKWSEFVDANQTLVFYMGLMGLPKISAGMISHGKNPETPVALIERGTLPQQKIHISTLQDIVNYVQDREIHAPTLLIIGDVVKLHNKLFPQ